MTDAERWKKTQQFLLNNMNDKMLFSEGLDGALIGVAERCGQPTLAVYDVTKCLDIFTGLEGANEEKAKQFIELSNFKKWRGEHSPLWFTPLDRITDAKDPDTIRKALAKENPAMLFADDLEAAIIGVAERPTQPTLAVFDSSKCVDALMNGDEMDYEEAVEWYEFNVAGGWHGEMTPFWFTALNALTELEDEISE